MKYKHYISLIIIAIIISCTPTKTVTETTVEEAVEVVNATKQNVLFIAIDDLKPLLNCYGNPQIKTPNIDKLAARSTVFLNNHCQQAVCAPSRASLMTGQFPDHTKVLDLKTLIRKKQPNVLTLPQYFKNNGYQTTAFGKIYDLRSVDKKHDAVSWSIPYQNVDPSEFEALGSLSGNTADKPKGGHYRNPKTVKLYNQYFKEGKAKGEKPQKYAMNNIKPVTENIEVGDEAYMDGLIAKMGVEQLQSFAKSTKPFFLAVGFKKPHLPFVAPKKYWDLYDANDIDMADYQEKVKGGVRMAYHNSGELGSYTNDDGEHIYNNLDKRKLSEAEQRHLIHGYYACVSYIDAQVGKLLDELEKQGLTENTTIVLWGDHGWHLGDHGLWCKHSNFEQGTRSPLLISSPNMTGNTTTKPTGLINIFPTLCELNGLPIPEQVESKSLVPLMKNPSAEVQKYTVHQFPRGGKKGTMGYGVRTENYRYVQWIKVESRTNIDYENAEIVGEEFYDYQKDKNETKNLINDANYKTLVKEHQAMMQEFFEKMK
ncbi:MAG: sulfatase [Saprospiraceae bacterium]